jgi:hypothetical protein
MMLTASHFNFLRHMGHQFFSTKGLISLLILGVFWIHLRFDFSHHSSWVSGYDPEIGYILHNTRQQIESRVLVHSFVPL